MSSYKHRFVNKFETLVPRFGLRTPVTERRQTEAQVREEEGKATGNHRLRLEFWITLKKSTFQ